MKAPLRSENGQNWILLLICAIALVNSSCNLIKKEKYYSKSVDKTQSSAVISKTEQTETKLDKVGQTETKQAKKDSLTNSLTELKTDTSTVITEKTKVTEFDTSGKKTKETETEKTTQKNHNYITKKAERNKLSKSDKSFIEKEQSNSRQIRNSRLDSLGKENKNISEIQSNKKLETKPDTIKNWLGFAIFLIVIAAAVITYFKFKK